MNIPFVEITELDPQGVIFLFTDALSTTVQQSIQNGEIGEVGWRIAEGKRDFIRVAYLAENTEIPGSNAEVLNTKNGSIMYSHYKIHVRQKVTISGWRQGEKGAIFSVDSSENVDFITESRFGDNRNGFIYVSEYHLNTLHNERVQEEKNRIKREQMEQLRLRREAEERTNQYRKFIRDTVNDLLLRHDLMYDPKDNSLLVYKVFTTRLNDVIKLFETKEIKPMRDLVLSVYHSR